MNRYSGIKINAISNYIGRGWNILLMLFGVPIYINLLGAESFGLIGLYAGAQAVLMMFDLGMGGALSREFAKDLGKIPDKSRPQKVLRTLESIYWLIALLFLIFSATFSTYVANHWLGAETLSKDTIHDSLVLMFAATAISWPTSLYSNGLVGLQKQVEVNIVSIVISTIRVFGSVLLIYYFQGTIVDFFIWHIIVGVLHSITLRAVLSREIKKSKFDGNGEFSFAILKDIWPYASRLSLVTVLSIGISQIDKVVLSGTLSLRELGYYVLASTIAQSLGQLSSPIADAIFPRLVNLNSRDESERVLVLFLKGVLVISIIVFPVAALLISYSHEVILLWISNKEVADNASAVSKVLLIGVCFNIAASTLDALQMTYGWFRPMLIVRLLALVLIGPMLWILSSRFGPLGAALALSSMFLLYLCVTPLLFFEKIFIGQTKVWLANWLPVLFASVAACFFLKNIFDEHLSSILNIYVMLFLVWLTTVLLVGVLVPSVRKMVIAQVKNMLGVS